MQSIFDGYKRDVIFKIKMIKIEEGNDGEVMKEYIIRHINCSIRDIHTILNISSFKKNFLLSEGVNCKFFTKEKFFPLRKWQKNNLRNFAKK